MSITLQHAATWTGSRGSASQGPADVEGGASFQVFSVIWCQHTAKAHQGPSPRPDAPLESVSERAWCVKGSLEQKGP